MSYVIIYVGSKQKANLYCAGTFRTRGAAVRYVQDHADHYGVREKIRIGKVTPERRVTVVDGRKS